MKKQSHVLCFPISDTDPAWSLSISNQEGYKAFPNDKVYAAIGFSE